MLVARWQSQNVKIVLALIARLRVQIRVPIFEAPEPVVKDIVVADLLYVRVRVSR